jgi:predicted RNA binding protein YcfA (HicA-like mRNA interferase family)
MLTNSHDIIRRLEREGWAHVRSKGSHRQYKHPTKVGRVTVSHPNKNTVSHPNKNIAPKTVADIYHQAGWPKD